jgi:hypothetical protein
MNQINRINNWFYFCSEARQSKKVNFFGLASEQRNMFEYFSFFKKEVDLSI